VLQHTPIFRDFDAVIWRRKRHGDRRLWWTYVSFVFLMAWLLHV
jgi:hypothetical protein